MKYLQDIRVPEDMFCYAPLPYEAFGTPAVTAVFS